MMKNKLMHLLCINLMATEYLIFFCLTKWNEWMNEKKKSRQTHRQSMLCTVFYVSVELHRNNLHKHPFGAYFFFLRACFVLFQFRTIRRQTHNKQHHHQAEKKGRHPIIYCKKFIWKKHLFRGCCIRFDQSRH